MSLRALRQSTVLSGEDAITAVQAARATIQQTRAQGRRQQFPDHTSYLRFMAGASIIRSRHIPRPIPSGVPSGTLYLEPTTNNGVTTVSPPTASPVGGKAYELNGTSSYLSVPADNSWNFGTGDFTIEWFQYQTDTNAFPRIFAIGSYDLGTVIGCSIEDGLFYAWYNNNNNYNPEESNYKDAWYHFSIVRNGNMLHVYKNGQEIGPGKDITGINIINSSNHPLYFGVEDGGANTNTYFGGYLTNIRIVKGLAVYTGSFTVPTSPLTQTAAANPYGGLNTQAIPAGYTKLLFVPT
jgi:hypothetical protein